MLGVQTSITGAAMRVAGATAGPVGAKDSGEIDSDSILDEGQ